MTQLTSLQQVSVNVHDLPRAVAFYKEKLGVRHLFDGGPRMSFFACEMGVRLMLAIPEKPEFDHPSSILYFKVEDIQAAHGDLAARGVAFREPPHVVARLPGWEVWMAFFDDSEGNLLAITQERSTA
jgi:predicted enzyme related to lactoylglutathione lyase